MAYFFSTILRGIIPSWLIIFTLLATYPDLSAASDIEGPRALGMGGAFTAIADGSSAVRLNPAGIALRRTYIADFSYLTTSDDVTVYNATIIDYKTTASPLGLSYTKEEAGAYLERTSGILSFAGGEGNTFMGLSLKYFSDDIEGKSDYTYDLGILYIPSPYFRIGLAGRNLENTDLDYVHTVYTIGAAYGLTEALTIAADYSEDQDIDGDNNITAAGIEYAVRQDVLVRGGYTSSKISDRDYYSAGFSLNSARLILEYGYRWDQDDRDINMQTLSAVFLL